MRLAVIPKVLMLMLVVFLTIPVPAERDDRQKDEPPIFVRYGYYGNPNWDDFYDYRIEGTPLCMAYWLWNSKKAELPRYGYTSFSQLKGDILKGKDVARAKMLASDFKYGFWTQWYGEAVGKWIFKLHSDWWEPWITDSLIGYSGNTEAIIWKFLVANFGEEYAAEALKSSRESFGAYAHLDSNIGYMQLDPEIFDKPIEYNAVSGGKGKISPSVFEMVEPDWVAFVENGTSHLKIRWDVDFMHSEDSYTIDSNYVEGFLEAKKLDRGKYKGARHFYLIFPAEFMKYLYRDTYPVVGTPDGLYGIPVNPKKPRTLWMWSAAFSAVQCYFWGGEGWSYWIPLGSLSQHEKYFNYYMNFKKKYEGEQFGEMRSVHTGASIDECLRQLAEQAVAHDMFREMFREYEDWKQDKADIPPDLPDKWVAFPYSKIAQKIGLMDGLYRPPSPNDIIWEMYLDGESPQRVTPRQFAQRFARKLYDWFIAKSARICRQGPFYKEYWLDWFSNMGILNQQEIQRFKDAHAPSQWNLLELIKPVYGTSTVTTTTTTEQTTVTATVTQTSQGTVSVTTVTSMTTEYHTLETFSTGQVSSVLIVLAIALIISFQLKRSWKKENDELAFLEPSNSIQSYDTQPRANSRKTSISRKSMLSHRTTVSPRANQTHYVEDSSHIVAPNQASCPENKCPILTYFNAKETVKKFERENGKLLGIVAQSE